MNIKFNYQTNSDPKHELFQEASLNTMLEKFKAVIAKDDVGFFDITNDSDLISATNAMAKKHESKKHFVQVGIGGSALGPQMLISALRKNWTKSFTLLDNTDSDYITDELRKIDIKNALFYVVSKSGGTAETIACYTLVRNLLLDSGVAKDELKNSFVFCTDPNAGQLRAHVNLNGYDSLEVPASIGGRYSVLSAVGLFPAAFMGIDIQALFEGANLIKKNILNENTAENDLLKVAAHTFFLFKHQAKNMPVVDETVLMPYSSKLKDLSFWFVQLWAESLGKVSYASKVPTGLTPIPAYGATDQHSQMQLFMEGTNNKLMMLLNIDKKHNDFKLDSDLELESASKLKAYSMNELMEAEYQGSVTALRENERSVIDISIDQLDEEHIGALVLFFESLTALMGEHLLVDPFNQPGVEKGKKYAFEYLHSLGK